MKVDTQSKQNIDNKDNTVQMHPEDNELLSSTNLPFSEMLNQQLTNNQSEIQTNSIYKLGIDYNYDTAKISIEDAMFFIDLTKDAKFSVETAPTGEFKAITQIEVAQNVASKKAVEVTNQIATLIEKAQKTQKPVRITFDNNVSVIIKIDKQGKVTAEFIPGSIEVENYLRNNIAALRQKFDEQNLPYNDLFYRQNGRQQNNRNKDKNKGEQ